jgi:hypothetical protein
LGKRKCRSGKRTGLRRRNGWKIGLLSHIRDNFRWAIETDIPYTGLIHRHLIHLRVIPIILYLTVGSIWLIRGVGRHEVGDHSVRVCTVEGVGTLWRGLRGAGRQLLMEALRELGGAGGQLLMEALRELGGADGQLLMGALRELGGAGGQLLMGALRELGGAGGQLLMGALRELGGAGGQLLMGALRELGGASGQLLMGALRELGSAGGQLLMGALRELGGAGGQLLMGERLSYTRQTRMVVPRPGGVRLSIHRHVVATILTPRGLGGMLGAGRSELDGRGDGLITGMGRLGV